MDLASSFQEMFFYIGHYWLRHQNLPKATVHKGSFLNTTSYDCSKIMKITFEHPKQSEQRFSTAKAIKPFFMRTQSSCGTLRTFMQMNPVSFLKDVLRSLQKPVLSRFKPV